MALEREAALERSKTQLVIDWQRRCDDTEREALCKQEGLVTSLTRARDEACNTFFGIVKVPLRSKNICYFIGFNASSST